MNRRKGVPCGCDADPCGCSPKNHCVKAINNVSPDPNGDFNIKAGAGIAITQTGDDEITIVNATTPSAYIAGKNIEFTPSGADIEINVVDDPVIDGTLTVNGDIIQNGAAYETHAEKVYTTNDYIVMRDGAIGGLAIGDYAGFQVEKYDGTNDGRLVIDRDGVARVGDVGDEQPLLTRSESAQLNNGDLLQWNGTDQKAVSASLNTSQIVRGSGSIGSDTKPVKVVNGVATEVSDALAPKGYIRAHFTGSQTIASNTVSVVNLNTSTIIDNDVFSFSSTTHKITVKKAGNYLLNGSLLAIFSASGRAEVAISYNTEDEEKYAIQFVQGLSGTESLSISCIMNLNANDQIGLVAWHSAGRISVSPNKMGTNLTMVYLGN